MRKREIEIVFCQNRKCPKVDCLRFHKNAPFDVMTKWMSEKPTLKENKCKYYLTT